jgi:hypothetical protein
MKCFIVSLAVLLVSFQVSGQKKSKVDPKDAQIDTLKMQVDSLTKVTKSLTLQLDSVSKELVKYSGLYTTISEKVIHYAFDPTRSAYLIDSLAAARDSTAARLGITQKAVAAPPDTIKAAPLVPVVPPVPAEELEKAKALSGLKQLKELLDTKIITDAEFLMLKKKYLDKL